MPFIYATIPAAAESVTAIGAMYTTSATANTIVDHLRYLTAAGRAAYIVAISLLGRAAAVTSLTGIAVRFIRLGTASTVGTAASLRPRDPGAPAAATTAFTGPTIGATPTMQLALGCGVGGPGGWVAGNSIAGADAPIYLAPAGGANGNLDMVSGTAGTVALGFDATIEHAE